MSNVKLQGNVSGTGSVTITSPNTNSDRTITLPDSSGTFVVDGASQSPTFNAVTTTTLSVAGNNISAVNSMGFRNRIINGDMRIDQRNAGASVTPAASTYTLDRWRVGVGTTQRMSFQQVVDAPAGFTNSILCTVTTDGSTSAGNLLYLHQNIEGFNVSDLGFGTASAKTVTASFWVKSSVVGLKSISLINASLNRAYCTTYNIDTANTWEYKTVTMPGDTSGTWGTGNGIGLELHFNFEVGSNFETTLNTWAEGRFYSASSVPDFTTTAGATISFTGVQLEAGSVASPFERRDYGRELMMCYRYFALLGTLAGGYTITVGRGMSNGGSAGWRTMIQVPAPMRATPTLTAVNLSGWNVTNSSVGFSSFGTVYLINGLCLETDINYVSAVGSSNSQVYLQTNGSGGASYLAVSSEL